MAAKAATGNHCAVDPNIDTACIDRIADQIQKQRRTKQEVFSDVLPDSFIVNNYRIRQEDWGVVIDLASEKSGISFISDDAFLILKRFTIGKTYFTYDVLQDISQEDRTKFLKGMARRGILKFV